VHAGNTEHGQVATDDSENIDDDINDIDDKNVKNVKNFIYLYKFI